MVFQFLSTANIKQRQTDKNESTLFIITLFCNIALRQAFLKPKLPNFLPQICNRSNLMSHSDGIFRQGKLRQKYEKKAPIIKTNENGEVQIEGVSNKQYPQVAPWTQPDYMFRGKSW